MSRTLLILGLSLPLPALACPAVVLPKHIDAELTPALADAEVRHEAVQRAMDLVPCSKLVIPSETAARLHLARAADDLLDLEPAERVAELRAARTAAPDLELPPSLSSLQDAWEQAEGAPDAPAAVEQGALPGDLETVLALLDADGSLRVDGRAGQRPVDHPAVIQLLDARGVVQVSAYIGPDDPLPPYPKASPPAVAAAPPVQAVAAAHEEVEPAQLPTPLAELDEPTKRSRAWVPAAAGGLVTVASGAWGLAERSRTMEAWQRGTDAQTWDSFTQAQADYTLHRDRLPLAWGVTSAGLAVTALGGLHWAHRTQVQLTPFGASLTLPLGGAR